MKVLSILILQYNKCSLTIDLLKSIIEHERGNVNDYQIIVVDNNSSEDNQFGKMRELIPSIITRQNEKNVGFANGINSAMDLITTPYLLLINNDIIVKNDAISICLNSIRSLGADAITCKMLNGEAKVMNNFSGDPHPVARLLDSLLGMRRRWAKKVLAKNLVSKVKYINGGFLLLDSTSFQELGFFHPKYFMYTEDLDLMIKMNKAQKTMYINPHAVVLHYDGISSEQIWDNFKKYELQVHQTLDCYKRHYSKLIYLIFFIYRVQQSLRLFLVRRDKRYIQVVKRIF